MTIFLHQLIHFRLIFSLQVAQGHIVDQCIFHPLPFQTFGKQHTVSRGQSARDLLVYLRTSQSPVLHFYQHIRIIHRLRSLTRTQQRYECYKNEAISHITFSLLFLCHFTHFLHQLPVYRHRVFPVQLFDPFGFRLGLLVHRLVPNFLIADVEQQDAIPILFHKKIELRMFRSQILTFGSSYDISDKQRWI